jgi:hypothetical protein
MCRLSSPPSPDLETAESAGRYFRHAQGAWRSPEADGSVVPAAPQEKITVPVSRDILAEVDDVVHLSPREQSITC